MLIAVCQIYMFTSMWYVFFVRISSFIDIYAYMKQVWALRASGQSVLNGIWADNI